VARSFIVNIYKKLCVLIDREQRRSANTRQIMLLWDINRVEKYPSLLKLQLVM
jgi:hypothetical protein